MNPEECKSAVLAAWRSFASGDPERVSACFTPDAQWLAPPGNATAVALGETHHLAGRERITRFLVEEFPALFVRDVKVEIGNVLCEGRTVILEERMQAGLANGRHYDNRYCFFFELDAQGYIHRVREYMDTRAGHECMFGPGASPGRIKLGTPTPRHPPASPSP